jgi:CHRD domain
MRSRLAVLVALVATLIGVLAAAGAAGAGDGGRSLSATPLTGAQEVPGPGDPDASGTADIVLNQGKRTVCFTVTWANIDGTVTASHIHRGAAGVAGDIVVGLFSGSFSGTDAASGCVENVAAALIKEIRQRPSAFYVNVHSDVFPAGAIRGQLSK